MQRTRQMRCQIFNPRVLLGHAHKGGDQLFFMWAYGKCLIAIWSFAAVYPVDGRSGKETVTMEPLYDHSSNWLLQSSRRHVRPRRMRNGDVDFIDG